MSCASSSCCKSGNDCTRGSLIATDVVWGEVWTGSSSTTDSVTVSVTSTCLFSVGSKLKSNVGAASVFCSVTSKFEKLKSNSGYAYSNTVDEAAAETKLKDK